MNKYPYVSEEKKRLVEEAMKSLNYYPNSSAQTLRSQKTDTIAVFIPMLTNPFFSHLLEGIDTVATEKGIRLLVCQTKYEAAIEKEFFNLLKSKQVDGIILTSLENDWASVREFAEHGPIVMCNEYDASSGMPNVCLDQVYGGYIGTRHLIEKGHRKIAFCQGRFKSLVSKARESGYKLALEEFGLAAKEEYAFRIAADYQDGKEVLKQMRALSDPPTAIFTGSDQVAAGLVYEARNLGLKVPEEIAVIGFDDQPIAEVTYPQLTTIRQPAREIGRRAMLLMLSKILSEENQLEDLEPLMLELIERSST